MEHALSRLNNWKILRDCRLKGNGVHRAMLGAARLHNMDLAPIAHTHTGQPLAGPHQLPVFPSGRGRHALGFQQQAHRTQQPASLPRGRRAAGSGSRLVRRRMLRMRPSVVCSSAARALPSVAASPGGSTSVRIRKRPASPSSLIATPASFGFVPTPYAYGWPRRTGFANCPLAAASLPSCDTPCVASSARDSTGVRAGG